MGSKPLVPDGRMIYMRHNRMQFTRVTLVGVIALGLLTPAYAAIAAPVEIQRVQLSALVAPMPVSIPARFSTDALAQAALAANARRIAAAKAAAKVAAARAAVVARARQARLAKLRAARGRVFIAPSRSRSTHPFGTTLYSKWFAQQWGSYKYNWNSVQFGCLNALWSRESSWRTAAANGSSGAYGIPQALPGYKMSSHGTDWRTNPETQIKWGASYIAGRYGNPCAAWNHHQWYGWY